MKKFLLTLLAIILMTVPAYLIAQLYYYNTFSIYLEIGAGMSGLDRIPIEFNEISEYFLKIWITLSIIIISISIVTVKTKPKQLTPAQLSPPQSRQDEIFCERCGAEISPDSKYCAKCGKKIK